MFVGNNGGDEGPVKKEVTCLDLVRSNVTVGSARRHI